MRVREYLLSVVWLCDCECVLFSMCLCAHGFAAVEKNFVKSGPTFQRVQLSSEKLPACWRLPAAEKLHRQHR